MKTFQIGNYLTCVRYFSSVIL